MSSLAQGIYPAFLDYKRKYNGNVTVPYRAETKQEVTVPTVVPQDVKEEKKEKKEKRKKSKMAQELADAREGRNEAPVSAQPAAPSVDSIVNAAPVVQNTQTKPSVQQRAEAKPNAQQRTEAKPSAPVGLMSTPDTPAPASTSAPVFKVQVMASTVKLKSSDPQLKGLKDVDFYQEGGLYKYTVGASADYREIAQLRKTVSASFPQAFIIAFRDGQKMNVQEAIQEFKNRK